MSYYDNCQAFQNHLTYKILGWRLAFVSQLLCSLEKAVLSDKSLVESLQSSGPVDRGGQPDRRERSGESGKIA
jgi:hypothetical protein